MGTSSVRRSVKHFKDGNMSIEDELHGRCPGTASTERNKERVEEFIRGDRRVTVNDIAAKLAVGHSAVQEMIQSLGYRKVCARWVPWLLTDDHRLQIRTIWVGNFHILPTVLNWHPPNVLLRNRCEANAIRFWRIFGKQCISVYEQLEWSTIAGTFSNLQNDGKNVCKKWRLC